MPPPFGFGGMNGMPPTAGPGVMTPQQLAGMSVLLQQQAAAAAMFSPATFNPLDPVSMAAAIQTQFANAVAASAANQMLAMQGGPMGGQPGPPPFAHLPPPGPPFGAGGLFRPPSGGNLVGFGGPAHDLSGQQPQQTDDGDCSFGQRRDAGGCPQWKCSSSCRTFGEELRKWCVFDNIQSDDNVLCSSLGAGPPCRCVLSANVSAL